MTASHSLETMRTLLNPYPHRVRSAKSAAVDAMPTPSRSDIEIALQEAFRGVVLGSGISLRQAQIIDNQGAGISKEAFTVLPQSEVTTNWQGVSFQELERNCIAHLDADGFRYYVPAFILSLLNNYEGQDRGALLAL